MSFDQIYSLPPLGDNQQFHHNIVDKYELLHDSLRLLTIGASSDSQYKMPFLYTDLIVATCCFCYRLLTCTHDLACDHKVISLTANMLSCPHTSDDVVNCFISLCLHHPVHEVSQCILIELKRKPLSTNTITALEPTFIRLSISLSNSELLTMVS